MRSTSSSTLSIQPRKLSRVLTAVGSAGSRFLLRSSLTRLCKPTSKPVAFFCSQRTTQIMNPFDHYPFSLFLGVLNISKAALCRFLLRLPKKCWEGKCTSTRMQRQVLLLIFLLVPSPLCLLSSLISDNIFCCRLSSQPKMKFRRLRHYRRNPWMMTCNIHRFLLRCAFQSSVRVCYTRGIPCRNFPLL